jgi:hypothetical protein
MRNRKEKKIDKSSVSGKIEWEKGSGFTSDAAFESLRRNLSRHYGWPEHEIFYEKRGLVHYIYYENTKFKFNVFLNNRTKEYSCVIES